MRTCVNGHQVDDGSRFCPECGASLEGAYVDPGPVGGTLAADAVFFFLAVIAVGCMVMFVWALVGAGQVNTQDKFETYAYVSGWGAVPWLIAAIAATGVAGWRAAQILDR